MFLKEAVVLLAFGLLTGAGLAYAGSQLLASRLYGVAAQDLLTTALAAVVLVLVALCASYIPAARASKTDPVIAMR